MPIQDIMKHAARAIQFIRLHANKPFVNLDKEKFFIQGGSAGGGIALWLNAHDDLQDLTSHKPLLRESTKPQGIVHSNSQFSYNLLDWEHIIGLPITAHYSKKEISDLYRCPYQELTTNPDCLAVLDLLDMPKHLDRTDSPMLFIDGNGNTGDIHNKDYYLHNPKHGKYLHSLAKELGIKSRFLNATNLKRQVVHQYILDAFQHLLNNL